MHEKLCREEIVTMGRMYDRGKTKTGIAEQMGVSEGTVRYHLRRRKVRAVDGRKGKEQRAAACATLIDQWITQDNGARPANLRALYEHLRSEYGYDASYKSVQRYVRKKYGKPALRTYRRIETPPGMMVQTDWAEFGEVLVGGRRERLSAFVMVLAHSRKVAVIWMRKKDQLSWQEAHIAAFERLGGVAAVNRIDNVKTAMLTAGPWGKVNPAYARFAAQLGFAIDACQPYTPTAKGKVEAKVRLTRLRCNPAERAWAELEDLQRWTDAQLHTWAQTAVCPATGTSVQEAWEAERRLLVQPLAKPTPYDVVVTRTVRKDCMVSFEGRAYSVPFWLVGTEVEVHGCAQTVEFYAEGRCRQVHPRHTACRILIDVTCYEGEATKTHLPPTPLSMAMNEYLSKLKDSRPQQRSLDVYARAAGEAP